MKSKPYISKHIVTSIKSSDPEKGTKRFCVILKDMLCYTIIGAENIHHAANKATLLWGSRWTNLSEIVPGFSSILKFCPVKEFGQRIKTLSKLDRHKTKA